MRLKKEFFTQIGIRLLVDFPPVDFEDSVGMGAHAYTLSCIESY